MTQITLVTLKYTVTIHKKNVHILSRSLMAVKAAMRSKPPNWKSLKWRVFYALSPRNGMMLSLFEQKFMAACEVSSDLI